MTWILIIAGITLSIHLGIALYSQHIVKRHVSLNLRVYEQAPPPLPTAESIKEDHFEPGRWWQVRDPDEELWLETSSEAEARREILPGQTLHRLYEYEVRKSEWRQVD